MTPCTKCGCVDSMKYALVKPRCVHEASCAQRVQQRTELRALREAVLEVEDEMSDNTLLTSAAPNLVAHFCAKLRKACGGTR